MKAKAYIVHQAMCEPELKWSKPKDCLSAEPLYTAPPQRQWVGLTGEEKALISSVSLDVHDAVHRAEAKLKEKNT